MLRIPPLPALALASALAAAPASAQSLNLDGLAGVDGAYAGVPAFAFLKLPVSARNIGLSARTLTTDEEASMVHGNPAGLALVGDYFYSLSHAEILGEFRHEDLALAFPTVRWGSFGLGANLLSATAFEDARDIDEEPSDPKAYDLDLSVAYGRTLVEGRMAAGARLDLVRSSIDRSTAYGYAASFGALFLLVRDWRLGAAIQNLSHGVRYDGEDSPLEPLPLTLGLELGKPLLDTRWSTHLGLSQGNDAILHYYAGGEFRLWKHLILRMGWDGTSQDRELGDLSGLAGGTGVKYDRLTLDYGFKSLGIIGSYHAVTLNYSRKANLRALDEIYLERALARQRKGNYASALGYARKAVAANPYNFKAQALAKQLQLELDRLDETAFSLIYTGATGGHLTSDWIDGKAVGGLARRKTKLMELKGSAGKSLIVDAGNLSHASSRRGEEHYVHAAYALMPYDAVNIGAVELAQGPEAWSGGVPWLSSQQPVDGLKAGILSEKTLRLKGGTEVMVIGALDPAGIRPAAGGAENGRVRPEEVAAAVRRRAETGKGRPRILILLLQGNLAAARKVADLAPELDVIVAAGEERATGSPMKVGKTLLCSPGLGGAQIGHLTLMVDGKGGGLRSFRHFLIPLDASVAEDEGIRKLLAPVTIDPNAWGLDGYDEDYRAQVVAYVRSPRPGAGGRIFLKDLRSGREYAVPPATSNNTRPILGYGKNRLAFLGQDAPGGPREVYSLEMGVGRVDTLTREGGEALDIRWILGNNALLAAYGKPGSHDLWRIDPWAKEARNLGEGRFGDVSGFDIDRSGGRLAVMGGSPGQSTLWVTSLKLEEPLPVAADRGFVGPPKWNPAGDRLAYISVSDSGDGGGGTGGGNASGELRVFDFAEKKLIPVTLQSRVREFSWSADGKRIYYVAGVNVLDINEYLLDSLVVRKATDGGPAAWGGQASGGTSEAAGEFGPRSEENPAPKVLNGRDGLLFEAAEEKGRRILWVDFKNQSEKVIADSAAFNSLR